MLREGIHNEHSPLPDYFTTLYFAPEVIYICFICVVDILGMVVPFMSSQLHFQWLSLA